VSTVAPAPCRGTRRAVAAAVLAVVVGLAGCTGSPSVSSSAPPTAAPTGTASPTAFGTVVRPSATGSGSPTASRRPTPSPTRTRAPGPPRPPVVRGYTLGAAPARVTTSFRQISRAYSGVFDGVTVRTVRRGEDQVGTLVVMTVDRTYAGRRSVERNVLPGIVAGFGSDLRTRQTTIGGQPVVVAEPEGATLVAWYRAGSVVLVYGLDDPAPALRYATAYVRAT
jgi:hypothetical protein